MNTYVNDFKEFKEFSKDKDIFPKKILKSQGGGACSICGAKGANKRTCPHNQNIKSSFHKSDKHNKIPIELTSKKTQKKTNDKKTKNKKTTYMKTKNKKTTDMKTKNKKTKDKKTNDIKTKDKKTKDKKTKDKNINKKKSENKKNEGKRVDFIVNSINDLDSEFGKKLRESYAKEFPGDEIKSASNTCCGGYNSHYDFKITTKKGEIVRCEEKSTYDIKKKLSDCKPWSNSSQATQAALKTLDLEFAVRYAKLYYNFMNELAIEYDVDFTNFSFEDYMKDFNRQDSCKTPQMISIKNKMKEKHNDISIQEAYPERVHDINTRFVKEVTDEEMTRFKEKWINKIDKVFLEKDCWLQTVGLDYSQQIYEETGKYDFTGSSLDCKFKWFGKIVPPKIIDIKLLPDIAGKAAQLRVKYIVENIDDSIKIDDTTNTTIRLRNKICNCGIDFR